MEYYRWALRSQLRAEGRAVRRRGGPSARRCRCCRCTERSTRVLLVRTAAASQRWAGPEHRLHVLAGTGHFPHEERPAATTDLLAEFLTR